MFYCIILQKAITSIHPSVFTCMYVDFHLIFSMVVSLTQLSRAHMKAWALIGVESQ